MISAVRDGRAAYLQAKESWMNRLTTSLALLGLVLAGCAGQNGSGKPGGSDTSSLPAGMHQATIEVKGMT